MTDLSSLLPRTHRIRCWERADRDPIDLLCTCDWSEVRWPQRTNKRPDCPIHGQTDRDGGSDGVVAGLVSAANELLARWDEFSDPSLFDTPDEGRTQLCAVLAEWVETLRSATDLVIPDDLHAWCVTADEYEALRSELRGVRVVLHEAQQRLRALVDGQPAPDGESIAGLVRLPPPYSKVLAEVVTEAPIIGDEGISVVQCVVECEPGTWVGVLTADDVDGSATPGPTREQAETYLPSDRDVGQFVKSLTDAAPSREQVWDAVLEVHRNHCSWPDSMTEAMVSETTDAVAALYGRSAPEPPAEDRTP